MTITDQTRATRRAEPSDRPELNRVLSAAFLDDPVFAWLVPDRTERQPMLPHIFDAFADAFARHDQTHLVPERAGAGPSGVAMWSPPGVAPVHPDDEEDLGTRLAQITGRHLGRFTTCMEIFEAAHPSEPAWFLQFLGVDPAHQRQGVGSTLLQDVLGAADRAGEAAYLEATSERNRILYERHGFECTGDLALPGGPIAFAMWREPRPGAGAAAGTRT